MKYERDMLPYLRHAGDSDSIIELSSGAVCATMEIGGVIPDGLGAAALRSLHEARVMAGNQVSLNGWSIWHHVVRRRAKDYPTSAPRTGVAAAIDAQWRAHTAGRTLMRNRQYLTLVRHGGLGFTKTLFGGSKQDRTGWVSELERATAIFQETLKPFRPRLLGLRAGAHGGIIDEPVSFLGGLFNYAFTDWQMPDCEIRDYLPQLRKTFGRDLFSLHPSRWGAMVSIIQYARKTNPSALAPLMALPLEMTITQSFSPLDAANTEDRLKGMMRDINSAKDGGGDYLYDEVNEALEQASTGKLTFGQHHFSVAVFKEDDGSGDVSMARRTYQAASEVIGALARAGIKGVQESQNMEPLFWGQGPGNFPYIGGRPAIISSRNWASLAALQTKSEGNPGPGKWLEPITVFPTDANTGYSTHLHVGTLGHFIVLGKSDEGKTALVIFILYQSQRLDPTPRVVYLDKDRSAEIAIRAKGGSYHVLEPGVMSGFNPFQLDDTSANRTYVAELIVMLLAATGAKNTADDQQRVRDAVDHVYALDRAQRNIDELAKVLPDTEAGTPGHALKPWVSGGQYHWLFGAKTDSFGLSAQWVGVDLTAVLESPILRGPAVSYIRHRINERLGEGPMIIVIEEGWRALADPALAATMEDWWKTIRKFDCVVGIITQQPTDLAKSAVCDSIVGNTATIFGLPNPEAQDEDYKKFNFTPDQTAHLRSLPAQSRRMVLKQQGKIALLNYDLSALGPYLQLLSTDPDRRLRCEALRAAHGEDPEVWVPEFLQGGVA